jgi:hypothetical protein
MSNAAKQEYLLKIKDRYHKLNKLEKKRVRDEFCEICSYKVKSYIKLDFFDKRLTLW